MPGALGIDVGVRKGLDLVLMSHERRLLESRRRVRLEDLGGLIGEFDPEFVAIDSPPAWGREGGTRETERRLRTLGIMSYGTPSDPRKAENPFYAWMGEGFRAFTIAAQLGFPRYREGPVQGTAIEVFPYASAVVLSGYLGPALRLKRAWRTGVLESLGVPTDRLQSLDQVDAALAALTGLLALQGTFVAPGDPDEGVIVLPCSALPEQPFGRAPPEGRLAAGSSETRHRGRVGMSSPAAPAGTEASRPNGADMRFETRAIHAGQEPESAYGAVSVPIYQTSTYAQEAVGKHKGYEYARTGNPTRTALETAVAALEEGYGGLCFASGMAAESTFFCLLKPGDHVVVANDVYGGTYRLVARVLGPAMGVEFDTVDLTDLEALKKAIREETRVVWVETPTNPLLKIIDIAAVAEIAHAAGAWCVVDNTFASPYLQQPIRLGADAVIHSATKYLGGHSDVVGGAIVTTTTEMHERLAFLQNAVGAVPGPQDCFLVLRGLKTLAVRMEAHSRNAARVAEFLDSHGSVKRVYYPGLPTHVGHDIAARQMRGFGGMVSFEMETEEEALEVCRRTSLFFLAESLGGVESLIEHPGRMTHTSVAGSPLEVPANLVRLSVGIEHPDDLVEDLAQALS